MKLLLGGSPCTYWSIAKTKNRETKPEGLGWGLFKNYLIALEKFKPDYFLYENNKSMSPAIREQITKELGVGPILINSALVSAQNRQRLYWTNIPGVEQPEGRGILLRDILESGIPIREKAYTLRAPIGAHGGPSSVLKTIKEPGKFSFNGVAGPVRIGTVESGRESKFDSQAIRVYSPDGKSVTLSAGGGGQGGKTGLYATPVRVGDMPNAEGKVCGSQFKRIYSVDGKSTPICATGSGGNSDTSSPATGLYAVAVDGTDELPKNVYEVRSGYITIKDKQYPIKLADGFYIIRKLTVRECMRLQTVPETFVFPVSNTRAYQMLGNGWTCDVIAHILSYCPGITTEPLEVLSMYDGMSCGRIALNKLGAHVSRYYATEIDKYAIKTTQHNFPDTIQLGDAFQVREDDWKLPGWNENQT